MPDIPRFTTMDPLAEKKPWLSPYHYCSNNPINKIDPDGRFDGFPVPNTTYWQQAAVNYQKQEHIKANAPEIQRNVVAYTASLTDINDTVVLGTTITRGGDAINVDGTPASGVDIGFASLGAIIPAVSGSLVKGALKAVGEALGIVSDTKKIAGSPAKISRTFTQTIKEGSLEFYSTKIGDNIIEFGGEMNIEKGVLTVKGFDIDGNLTNKFGVSELRSIINDFGKQQGVNKVIIEGTKRTTGANPGKVPSPIEFLIKND